MKKNIKWLLSISLVIIAVIGIFTVLYFILPKISQSVGFSTLSLNQADLTSSLPSGSPFSGQAWVLTVRLGGLGQSAYGTFTPDDIQDATDDESTTENDFTLSIESQSQQCRRQIEDTSYYTPIKNVNYISWTYVPVINPCTSEEAESRGDYDFMGYYDSSQGVGRDGFTCFAPYYTGEQSPVGNFGSENYRFQADINIQAGSRSATKHIDSLGSSQGPISDFAYVLWQGNLVTGQTCPSVSSYKSTYVNGNWRVINVNNYNSYLNKIDEAMPIDYSVFTGWIDEINSRAVSSRQSVSYGSIEQQSSLTNAVLVTDLASPIQNPILTFYIKASTLGIYTPAPELDLISANSDCFDTGEEGIIHITAKNTGDEAGNWNFFGTCPAGFSITEAREYSFNAGQKKTVSMPISGSASQRLTGTCTISAEGVSGTETIDVEVCVDPQITCPANQKFCSVSNGVEVVKQCSADGATSTIVEYCDAGYICQNAKCVKEGGGGGGGVCGAWISIAGKTIIPDLFCLINNFVAKFKIIFSIVAGILAGLIGLVFGVKFTKELSPKMRTGILIALFLALGIGIGLTAFYYFWTCMIILALLIIAKIFL